MSPVDLTHPSPNHSARPPGTKVTLCVLHADAGQSDAGTLAWCADPASKVSYHVLIGRMGQLYTLVPFARKAWHAGVSVWQGWKDCNVFSLGIAFANKHDGIEALTPLQVATGLASVEVWAREHGTLEVLTTHAAIAPERKSDPLKCPGFVLADFEAAFAKGVKARVQP